MASSTPAVGVSGIGGILPLLNTSLSLISWINTTAYEAVPQQMLTIPRKVLKISSHNNTVCAIFS